ncbi:MAG TPA: hypothetical protein VMS22_19030 [Candidatus Eisenbacteria bacterium]|nr:hypothetical protein [Candidatus Eisenbacteria bacterium]
MRALGPLALACLSATAVLAAPPGAFDPSFNGGNPVLLDVAKTVPRSSGLTSVVFDAQGRIMVAGNTTDATAHTAVLIARLLGDGTVDATFGDGGSRIAQMGLGSGTNQPYSVAFSIGPRPAGAGWLVGGYASGSDDRRAPFAGAFDAGGGVDIGFGNGGSVRPQPAGSAPAETFGEGAGFAADGTSYVACTIETTPATGANRMFAVVAVTPQGQPLTSFGTQPGAFVGSFSQTTDTGSYGSQPLVTPNGILVAGTTLDATGRQQILLVRLTSGGLLDTGFAGGAGFVRKQVADTGGSDSQGSGVAVGPSGEIYLAGRADDSDDRFAFSVTRITVAGNVDATFGTAGTRHIQTSLGTDQYSSSAANDVAVQADGKVILVGSSSNAVDQNEAVVLRLDVDGNLDPSFGASGVVRIDMGDRVSLSSGVIAPDGNSLVVAGGTSTGSVASGLVARILLVESTTTTTTLVPGGCEAVPSIAGARCRIGVLSTALGDGAPEGRLKTRVTKTLTRAAARLDGAEALSGRKRKARLRKAGALLRRASHQLGSRLAQRTLPESLRTGLRAQADAIATELATLAASA